MFSKFFPSLLMTSVIALGLSGSPGALKAMQNDEDTTNKVVTTPRYRVTDPLPSIFTDPLNFDEGPDEEVILNNSINTLSSLNLPKDSNSSSGTLNVDENLMNTLKQLNPTLSFKLLNPDEDLMAAVKQFTLNEDYNSVQVYTGKNKRIFLWAKKNSNKND